MLLVLAGLPEGLITHHDAAEVGDVFALRQVAVNVQRVDGNVTVELFDDHSCLRIEPRAVFRGPPVVQVSPFVIFASLVVEPVRDFVPERGAPDNRVQQRIVCQLSFITGDEDVAPRNHDLIVGGIVVRIVRLRLHFPLGAVDGLPELRYHVVESPLIGVLHVLHVRRAVDLHARKVFPFIGIADFHDDRAEFPERLFLGRLTHPVQCPDSFGIDILDGISDLKQFFLRPFRQIFRDVHPADQLTERAVGLFNHAFPPRLGLLNSAQRRGIETKGFAVSLIIHVTSQPADQMKPEIIFPVVKRERSKISVQRAQKFGLPDDNRVHVLQPGALHENGPVEIRRALRELLKRHFIVILQRVPGVFPFPGCVRNGSFQLYQILRSLSRFGIVIPYNQKHILKMLSEFLADHHGARVGIEIKIPVGQAQSPLRDKNRIFAADFVILSNAESKQGRSGYTVNVRRGIHDPLRILDAVDPVKISFQALDPVLIQRGAVHAGQKEVADFLFVAPLLCIR